MMDETLKYLQLAISGLTLLGFVIAYYKFTTDPDVKLGNRLSVMNEACKLKHSSIDHSIRTIEKDISFVKENHVAHIERDISDIKGDIKAIESILRMINPNAIRNKDNGGNTQS